jgi:hypothetical protein
VALIDMQSELRGCVPKLSFAYSKTLVNRAWRVVREQNLWSFNLFESSWTSPPIMTTGAATVITGSDQIQFDADATAAINAAQLTQTYSLITQRQFRIGVSGIYNLIEYNSILGSATLDRIWGDPSFTDSTYQLYQLYYTPPMSDFVTWLSVRNPTMFLNLELVKTRKQLDALDPQRLWYAWPTDVVPWGIDQRGAGTDNASATLGYMMFELWGQPINPFTYQCYGIRKGADLVNPTDTLPFQIGEDIILALARSYAYEWAEANKDSAPRNSGPDFKFLIGRTLDEYKKLLIMYRRQDRELVDNWGSIRGFPYPIFALGHYNTLAGVAGSA